MQKALKEPPCFDCYILYIAIYLGLIQTLQGYFEDMGYCNEKSFMVGTQKLQGYSQFWFWLLKIERFLQGKPITNMDKRLYWNLLLKEILEENSIFFRGN